ncbi:hypothetical protein AM228_26905 [Planktothricoides sp. SR001]|nr:hypothetical protein AM228_26905 [Planktothricoides sp. SR001]
MCSRKLFCKQLTAIPAVTHHIFWVQKLTQKIKQTGFLFYFGCLAKAGKRCVTAGIKVNCLCQIFSPA